MDQNLCEKNMVYYLNEIFYLNIGIMDRKVLY